MIQGKVQYLVRDDKIKKAGPVAGPALKSIVLSNYPLNPIDLELPWHGIAIVPVVRIVEEFGHYDTNGR